MARNAGFSLIALAVLSAVALSPAAAQKKPRPADAKDEPAQNFLAEHQIGRRFQIHNRELC